MNAQASEGATATAVPLSRRLVVEFLDTWHMGTGRAEAQHLDAVVDRDEDGLPAVSARTLRGLIRDACECLAEWGHEERKTVDRWFGTLAQRTDSPGRAVSVEGGLAFMRGRLPQDDRMGLAALPSSQRKRLVRQLYLQSFQTAIDPTTGSVVGQSLRGIELAVPLCLHAGIEVLPNHQADATQAWQLIERALPLVWAAGAHKSRGHGRVRLTLTGDPA